MMPTMPALPEEVRNTLKSSPWFLWGLVLKDQVRWQKDLLSIDRTILSHLQWGIVGPDVYLLELDESPLEKYLLRRVYAPRKQLELESKNLIGKDIYRGFIKHNSGELGGQYKVISWDWEVSPHEFSPDLFRGQFTKL